MDLLNLRAGWSDSCSAASLSEHTKKSFKKVNFHLSNAFHRELDSLKIVASFQFEAAQFIWPVPSLKSPAKLIKSVIKTQSAWWEKFVTGHLSDPDVGWKLMRWCLHPHMLLICLLSGDEGGRVLIWQCDRLLMQVFFRHCFNKIAVLPLHYKVLLELQCKQK